MPNTPRLISIVGGESTGKSTLAAALGAELSATVVSEYLRTWIDQRQGHIPNMSEQASVMAGQRDWEELALDAAAKTGQPWVIADSGPLMTAVYSIQYYDDASILPTALKWVQTSELVVWCQDDFPWQQDPQRDGPHARTESQQILAGIFAEYSELPLLTVDGPLAQRVKTVIDGISVERATRVSASINTK